MDVEGQRGGVVVAVECGLLLSIGLLEPTVHHGERTLGVAPLDVILMPADTDLELVLDLTERSPPVTDRGHPGVLEASVVRALGCGHPRRCCRKLRGGPRGRPRLVGRRLGVQQVVNEVPSANPLTLYQVRSRRWW